MRVLLVGYETVDIIGREMYTTTKGGGGRARFTRSIFRDDTPNSYGVAVKASIKEVKADLWQFLTASF
jgi:hypothetical protein